jgi:hypothetical protein
MEDGWQMQVFTLATRSIAVCSYPLHARPIPVPVGATCTCGLLNCLGCPSVAFKLAAWLLLARVQTTYALL